MSIITRLLITASRIVKAMSFTKAFMPILPTVFLMERLRKESLDVQEKLIGEIQPEHRHHGER